MVDLYYCRAERMQNKAEILKHETHFFQKAPLFHLQGLWGKVEGPNGGGRGKAWSRMKKRDLVWRGTHLHKSLSTHKHKQTVYSLCKCGLHMYQWVFVNSRFVLIPDILCVYEWLKANRLCIVIFTVNRKFARKHESLAYRRAFAENLRGLLYS